MDRPIELIPLVCVRCSTPVPANPDEAAWACAQCGQGLVLDEARGLAPLEVNYAAGIAAAAVGRPFWVAAGRAAVRRDTYRGDQRSARESLDFWQEPRQFYLPAYDLPLEGFLQEGLRLLRQPPTLTPGPAARFQPATLRLEDVQSAAEFLVVAVEAERADKLKEIQFSLELAEPSLWIFP